MRSALYIQRTYGKNKCTAARGSRDNPYRTLMLLYDLMTGSEAYTTAFMLLPIVQAVKYLEYLFMKFGIDADACIPDLKLMVAVRNTIIYIHYRSLARHVKLNAIGYKILEKLYKAGLVRDHTIRHLVPDDHSVRVAYGCFEIVHDLRLDLG